MKEGIDSLSCVDVAPKLKTQQIPKKYEILEHYGVTGHECSETTTLRMEVRCSRIRLKVTSDGSLGMECRHGVTC